MKWITSLQNLKTFPNFVSLSTKHLPIKFPFFLTQSELVDHLSVFYVLRQLRLSPCSHFDKHAMTSHIPSLKHIIFCHAGVISRCNASRSRRRHFVVVQSLRGNQSPNSPCVWSRNLKNEEAKTRKWVAKASRITIIIIILVLYFDLALIC